MSSDQVASSAPVRGVPETFLLVTRQAVKSFPEVMALPVEEQLQHNVEKLKKDWKMTDKVIPNVIKRQPAVLGYNVDCEGNCQGDCNRCWVRF